jgi:hypothetical protein
MATYAKLDLVSIDAWRECEGGWTWNTSYRLEAGIWLEESRLTPRKILSFLRKAGYLTDASKGRVRVEEIPTFEPFYEIQDKNTGEPLLALQGEWKETRESE